MILRNFDKFRFHEILISIYFDFTFHDIFFFSQEDDQLFFTSTRNIQPRQELRVGYSPAYCEARGLRPPLQPGPDDQHLGKNFSILS